MDAEILFGFGEQLAEKLVFAERHTMHPYLFRLHTLLKKHNQYYVRILRMPYAVKELELPHLLSLFVGAFIALVHGGNIIGKVRGIDITVIQAEESIIIGGLSAQGQGSHRVEAAPREFVEAHICRTKYPE